MVELILNQTDQDTFINGIETEMDLPALKLILDTTDTDFYSAHSDTFQTPLTTAAGADRVDVMEYLISCNAGVDDRDNAGYTSLHWTAINGSRDATEFLLSHNANPEITDTAGRTALQLAQENNENIVAEMGS